MLDEKDIRDVSFIIISAMIIMAIISAITTMVLKIGLLEWITVSLSYTDVIIMIMFFTIIIAISKNWIGNAINQLKKLLKGVMKMIGTIKGTIKRLWKENFLFFLSMLIIIALVLHFFVFPRLPKFINAYNALPMIVLPLIPIVIILSALGLLAVILFITIYNLKDNKLGKFKLWGENGIIRDVPANNVWVLRKAFLSKPGDESHDPTGYILKEEGWSYYIPIWHIDMGFINLAPEPHDPKPTKVNTSDRKTVNIDWRRETYISNPRKYVVRVRPSKNRTRDQVRQELETQTAKVIFAQKCSGHKQKELIKFGDTKPDKHGNTEDKLKNFGEEALIEFNEKMKFYGIKARDLSVQKILPPQDVIDAAEYETVTNLRKKVAPAKTRELKTIIDGTGASPTITVAADIIRGVLGDIISPFVDRLNKKGGGDNDNQ